MTYLCLRRTCRFKAAVIGAGATNAFKSIEKRPEMERYVYSQLIPGYSENKEQALTERSPVFWADEMCNTTPMLILHGSADWRVSPSEGLEMLDILYASKMPVRFQFYEGGDHGLREFPEEVDWNVRSFLDRYVKRTEAFPSLEPHGK